MGRGLQAVIPAIFSLAGLGCPTPNTKKREEAKGVIMKDFERFLTADMEKAVKAVMELIIAREDYAYTFARYRLTILGLHATPETELVLLKDYLQGWCDAEEKRKS